MPCQAYIQCYETSILFHTLVKFVDAEDITNETIRTLDLTLEVNFVLSKFKSQSLSSELFDPNLETMFEQATDPSNKSKPQFRK